MFRINPLQLTALLGEKDDVLDKRISDLEAMHTNGGLSDGEEALLQSLYARRRLVHERQEAAKAQSHDC